MQKTVGFLFCVFCLLISDRVTGKGSIFSYDVVIFSFLDMEV